MRLSFKTPAVPSHFVTQTQKKTSVYHSQLRNGCNNLIFFIPKFLKWMPHLWSWSEPLVQTGVSVKNQNGISNRVDSDETAKSRLIRIYTVCENRAERENNDLFDIHFRPAAASECGPKKGCRKLSFLIKSQKHAYIFLTPLNPTFIQ